MTAFLFPGQLSEFPGMGSDFYGRDAEAREVFEKASEYCGFDLYRTLAEGPEEVIRQNRVAQPAVFVMGVLAGRNLERRGIHPSALCGYSLGNYAALVAAGALSFEDALTLILAVMEESDRRQVHGAMGFVIGIPVSTLEADCAALRREGRAVWIGNVNAATQVVLTGSGEGVASALERVAPRALKAAVLPMTWPIHSPLFEVVSEGIRPAVEACRSITLPKLPLYAGHVAGRIESEEEVRDLLIRQISLPSRWKETVEEMYADGHRHFLEVGPGETLSKMMRWIIREATCIPAGSVAAIDAVEKSWRQE